MTYSTEEYKTAEISYTLPWHYRLLKRFEVHRVDMSIRFIEPCEKLVDIGCMYGDLGKKLGDNVKHYCGIDVVEKHIQQAQKLMPDAEFLCLNVDDEKTPFSNASLDTVAMISVLQFVINPEKVVEEVARIVKPGGVFVLEVPNIAFLAHRIRLLCGKLPRTSCSERGWDGGTLHYFTYQSLKKMLEKQGFAVEKVSGSGIFAVMRNWWPQLLCGDLIVKCRKK